jgi:hypothetical protein
MREEIQENVSVRFRDTGREVRNRALTVVSIIMLAVAGISIYMVKAYLPTVGLLLLWAFGFFVVLGMLTALVAFVKWLGRGLCCKKSGRDAMDVKAHLPVQLRQPLQTGWR